MLLELMIINLLGGILLLGAANILVLITKHYIASQQKFQIQHNMLIARHYLRRDGTSAFNAFVCEQDLDDCDAYFTSSILSLKRNHGIKQQSNILILQHENDTIIYYLRKSIVPNSKTKYALYRDDVVHNAQALVENIMDFTAQITQSEPNIYRLIIRLVLEDRKTMEITCSLNTSIMEVS